MLYNKKHQCISTTASGLHVFTCKDQWHPPSRSKRSTIFLDAFSELPRSNKLRSIEGKGGKVENETKNTRLRKALVIRGAQFFMEEHRSWGEYPVWASKTFMEKTSMNCRRQFARASSVGWLFARAACRGSLKQSQNILVDSSSTEEIPLPGEQPPVYSDFMAKVHPTDTESEVEAAGEAAKEAALPMGWKSSILQAAGESEQAGAHPPRLLSKDLLEADRDRPSWGILRCHVAWDTLPTVELHVAKSGLMPSILLMTVGGISITHLRRNGVSSAMPAYLSSTGTDSASSFLSLTDLVPTSFPRFGITLLWGTWRGISLIWEKGSRRRADGRNLPSWMAGYSTLFFVAKSKKRI